MWVTILLVIFGWLLGLLTQPIVERIRTYYKKKEVMRGIFTELKEYKYRMALSAWGIERDFGTYDKEFLEWTRDNIKEYESTFTYKKNTIIEGIEKLLKLDDKKLALIREKEKRKTGRSLKKDDLPYINSNIGYLPLFDTDFHNKVLEIRTHNRLSNDEMELALYYYKMTFDMTLDEGNRDIIGKNLDSSYKHIASNSRQQVHRINQLFLVHNDKEI